MVTRGMRDFYQTSLKITILRLLVTGVFAIVLLLPLFISRKNKPLYWVIIIKAVIPSLSGPLYMTIFSKYVGMKFGLVNEGLIKEKGKNK
jgi:ABC-type arginine/histidine transport system permease subunit